MKYYFSLILTLIVIVASAQRYEFEQVIIPAVENPVYVAISPNGLKMVLIDLPRKSLPKVLQCNRPYLESAWGAAYGVDAINKQINDKTRIDGLAFSFDNKHLYLAANFESSLGGMDIFRCSIDGDQFGEPKNIGKPVNTEVDENFPSVSGNMRWLFFTREVPIRKLESFKTGELWSANFNDELDNWNSPEKINTEINSGGIAYAKIYDDNKTLYYSRVVDSKEKWKIHWASKFTNIHWYLPVAFDTLKTKHNEISPFYCKQDGYLYYIVYDDSGFNPTGTIYRYKVGTKYHPQPTVEIKGKIIDAQTKKPVSAKVWVTDPIFGDRHFYTQSDSETGNWRTLINADNTYMFHFWAENYSHQYHLFEKADMCANKTIDLELFTSTKLVLNVYDNEEFWPLDAQIAIYNNQNEKVNTKIEKTLPGQFSISLPIGENYTFDVSMKDYESNRLNLDLTNIVLFDEFLRDIELKPKRREIEIHIFDQETNSPLTANIDIMDKRNTVFYPEAVQGRIGHYHIALREGEAFEVEVRGAKGFAFKYHAFDLNADRMLKVVEIPLSPLTRKVPIALDNINFEFNSADLMENSFEELNRVVTLMNDNPEIHVEIMAHTDDVGSDRYNEVLAEKRAQSVVDYLIVNGINHERLVARGYGKRMPLVPNTSDENRAKNRRVEMKIYDKDDQEFYIEERLD